MSAKTLALVTMTFIISCCFSDGWGIHAATKPGQKVMIVAAFGTSLTHRAGWLQPLEKELTRCLGHQVTVLDFGRSGATSEWGAAAIGAVIRAQPDVVLVEFSVNDAAWFKGLSLQRSQENTTKILRAIKEARPTAEIFLMTMNQPSVREVGFDQISTPTTISINYLPINWALDTSTIGRVGKA